MRRLRGLDWEAIAGSIAALVAILLHLLDVADDSTLLAIILFILAIVLIHNLRRQAREERVGETLRAAEEGIRKIQAAVSPPDTVLVGPSRLRTEAARFAQRAQGDMIWYNVCLSMFKPQQLFDVLLKPAIENPRVASIRFVLDGSARDDWRDVVMEKVAACSGAGKVAEPKWTRLQEDVSFIIAATGEDGAQEALLSFWGEPFMARQPGRSLPRYVFWVQSHSELIGRLIELTRFSQTSG